MASKKPKVGKQTSAMDTLLSSVAQARSAPLTLSAHYPTVLSVARSDVTSLLDNNPGLHISEARELLQRARAMSVVVARQLREQRLTASMPQANRPPTGVKGLVDGPTYTDMFNPDWANQCPPDAIEATTSPVAYLADLYRYAKELEATGRPEEVITLDSRRPDLKDLMLDHTALNRIEPTIVLVNEILETSIRSHLDGIGLEAQSVDDAMLRARYPNALPFERYTSQINYVLGRKDYGLGDVIRQADPAYPYFKEPGVHSLLSDIALIQDTRFGPVQQSLLLEAPYFADTETASPTLIADKWRIDPRTRLLVAAADQGELQGGTFFPDNFGTGGAMDLEDTQTFCLRTGLKTEELEALLSVGAFAPSRSPSVAATDDGEVDGSCAGSVYINAGQAPAMAIETLPGESTDGTLIVGPRHRITNATPDRFDRMNRMIRLARWLDLPFDEVDQLLTAAQQAEQHGKDKGQHAGQTDAGAAHLISQDTLRALGLFQRVRSRHKVSAQDFSAMLYGLSVHARGKTPSQFDQVFNSQAMFSIPLILDNTPFIVLPANEAERQKIDHLCAALGMTYETYRFVVKFIEQSWGGEPLRWSRQVVSAFYRLVRLPRYIGLSSIEALALLTLLNGGGSQLVAKLAGITRIASYYASSNTDTLNVVDALVDCAAWLQDSQWTVAQLCHMALPLLTQPVATDAERNLLQQLHSRLTSALISDSSFAQVGVPDSAETLQASATGESVYVSEPIDWFEALSTFIDTGAKMPACKGLVKYLKDVSEENFENTLSSGVKSVLEQYRLPVAELQAKITNMIMRARGAQEALLMEGLGDYLNTSADLAKALLFWTEGNRYQLLQEVLRVSGTGSAAGVPIGDEVLLVLDALSRRAALCTQLTLSPALITLYVEHPGWFGLADTALSMQALYLLTQYAKALRLSEQSEDRLLDYFRLINTLWAGATEGDKRLIRDSAASRLAGFLQWGIRDVLAVALLLNPEDGVIFTLADFDVLVRVCLLSRHTGLDANALLALHELTPTTSTEGYRRAAQLALSCLTDAPPASAVGEVGQSHSSVISVTPDYLVAQRDGDYATYTITLRDFMDEPLSDITINWSTDLGVLDQSTTTTDENGQASTTLGSGSVMGIARMVASYGLGEKLLAPVVVIDCDEASLHFVDGEHAPSKALAGRLEPIDFWVTLVDAYGNKGIDRAVEWATTLGEFLRYQTYTDPQGLARAELRSRSAGICEVVARYKNAREWEFIAAEFVSIPYFQYVRFNGTVVESIETLVACRLVELDGSPVVGKVITWQADPSGLVETQTSTDSNGVATARFNAEQEGSVVVTASAADPIEDKSSARTTVYPVVAIDRSEASSSEFLVGSPDPIIFSVWLKAGSQPVRRYPVEWLVNDRVVASTLSDIQGKATYTSRFPKGRHIVRAVVSGVNLSVEFPVFATPPLAFRIGIRGTQDPQSPDLLARSYDYAFVVHVIDENDEIVEGVEFKLDHVRLPLDYHISDVGKTILSSWSGAYYPITLSASAKYGDIEIVLSGRLLRTLRKTYRLGFFFRFTHAYSRPEDAGCKMYFRGHAPESVPGYPPGDGTAVEPYDLTFTCVSKSWSQSKSLRQLNESVIVLIEEALAVELAAGDLIESSRATTLNGYAVFLPGIAYLGMPPSPP